ncbi:MAG TPA: TauD/TfdA family dioxygenase, partial [Reyranella sp.]|nr:TauD/TfdA family dioxygenase [Reyranella sp.]
MAQSFDVQPVDASFGAVITGVRIPELDQPTWQALHDTWLKYALLIFPGQFLRKDEQIAFAKRFGQLEFEMGAVSNVREDGTLRVEAEGDDVVKILKG